MALLDTAKLFKRPVHNLKVIDGIRAIAILWVILFHVWLFHITSFPEECSAVTGMSWLVWLTRGDLGVDLFFVISGFLIGSILFKEYKRLQSIRIKRFYTRRFLRLMPAYLAFMFVGVVMPAGTPMDKWPMAWANLLYINNYIWDSYMPWTWSLAIEEQFYLVIPFLILFVFPKVANKFWLFLGLAIIPIAPKLYFTLHVLDYQWPLQSVFLDDNWESWLWNYYGLTHFRYGGLLAGVIIAYLHVYKTQEIRSFYEKNKQWTTTLVIISVIMILCISSLSLGQWSNVEESIFHQLPRWIGNTYESIHRELFYYAVAFLIMTCIYSEVVIIQPLKRFLSSEFFFPIAQVSYSAYLFHEMFMYLYFPWAKVWLLSFGLPVWLIMILNGIVSLIAVLFVASLVFLLIEVPFNKLKDRKTNKATSIQ